MSIREDIIAVRNLINTPDKFATGAMAKNVYGITVSPFDDEAVCWCLVGAIRKTTAHYRPGTNLYRVINNKLGTKSIADWSDTHGYDAVMELLNTLEAESNEV